MVSINLGTEIGFDMYPSQPPCRILSSSPFMAKAVTAMTGMEAEEGSWVALGAVGTQLSNLSSDFDPRTFGSRKLSDLVRKTGVFDIEHPEGGSTRIRKKQQPKGRKKA